MGHSIPDVVQEPGYLRATMSMVYREYLDSGKSVSAKANWLEQQQMGERDHRRLVTLYRQDPLQLITQ